MMDYRDLVINLVMLFGLLVIFRVLNITPRLCMSLISSYNLGVSKVMKDETFAARFLYSEEDLLALRNKTGKYKDVPGYNLYDSYWAENHKVYYEKDTPKKGIVASASSLQGSSSIDGSKEVPKLMNSDQSSISNYGISVYIKFSSPLTVETIQAVLVKAKPETCSYMRTSCGIDDLKFPHETSGNPSYVIAPITYINITYGSSPHVYKKHMDQILMKQVHGVILAFHSHVSKEILDTLSTRNFNVEILSILERNGRPSGTCSIETKFQKLPGKRTKVKEEPKTVVKSKKKRISKNLK